MLKGYFKPGKAYNEPIRSYAPGTADREALKATIKKMKENPIEAYICIGDEHIETEQKVKMTSPHDHKQVLGHYYKGDKHHVEQAINSCLGAKPDWEALPWEQRAAIFLKAADLITGKYRYEVNAATILAQSKSPHQSEIDAVCELADFFRYNVEFMMQIYGMQPESDKGIWNRLEYRPLEGFILAVTPFNFTSIAVNLPAAPVLMGNTAIWKPSDSQVYSAFLLMKILQEAGLPAGVINLVYADGEMTTDVAMKHPDFAGLHFTGSTEVFKTLWKKAGDNIHVYKNYPRIVGETGGKDFIIAHRTADSEAVAVAMLRGAFEFQGQKCSAASRVYLPSNLYDVVMLKLTEDLKTVKMGSPEDFGNFFNAVINEKAFDRIAGYIDRAKKSKHAEIITGGNYDKSKGYFIEPTIILALDPMYETMKEEIFGPVLTVYKYEEQWFEEALQLVEQTSPYALTGAIFSQDRYSITLAETMLSKAAGNFYINDKPTGAVVGQQPFGGARASGTNDKAGSLLNLVRWVSPRTIKENFNPPTDYRYPFLG